MLILALAGLQNTIKHLPIIILVEVLYPENDHDTLGDPFVLYAPLLKSDLKMFVRGFMNTPAPGACIIKHYGFLFYEKLTYFVVSWCLFCCHSLSLALANMLA